MARIAAYTSQATRPGDATAPVAGPQPAVPVGPRPTVGRLSHVPASRLWATDTAFASWLATNLDALGEAVSIKLTGGEIPNAGSPIVIASQPSGASVVIVCEVGEASDEAFGRLVRTVAASEAKNAIWVCGDPGQEYGASVSWLNRAVEGRFIMVRVKGVTIGESTAAPMFEVAVRAPRRTDTGLGPASEADAARQAPARRVDDWLDSVGAKESPNQG